MNPPPFFYINYDRRLLFYRVEIPKRKRRKEDQKLKTYPSSFALILQCLFRVLSGGLNVVDGVFHIVLDPIDHFTLYSSSSQRHIKDNRYVFGDIKSACVPCLCLNAYLVLDQHGHVHKHVMQLADRVLQFHNVGVASLNVRQRLPGLLRLHNDLKKKRPEQCKLWPN